MDAESAETKSKGGIAKLLALPNDSVTKTLIVAIVMCFVCSIMVSAAAVLLKPYQFKNALLDRKKNILEAAGLMKEGENIETLFQKVTTQVVDLNTGEYTDKVDPKTYDQRDATNDPNLSQAVAKAEDIAGIRRRPHYANVYLVQEGNQLKKIILPVEGYGLWSTLYGFLALEADGNTIAALKFYEHQETPGLGAEVDNLSWQAQWHGKRLFDDHQQLRIEVIKGNVNKNDPAAKYQVDGLAGSTLTSRGITNLLRYWLSEQGFAPYLARLRSQPPAH